MLEALLEKFADHGVQTSKTPKVLELPPFDQIGTKTQIRRGIFGGVEHYARAIRLLSTPSTNEHSSNNLPDR